MQVKESFVAFLDVETTGLVPGHDEICEIATVLTDWDLKEISRIDMKVRLSDPMKMRPEAAAINGYDPEVWAREAKPFYEWSNWLGKHVPFGHVAIPVGHNVGFDRDMIDLGYYRPYGKWLGLSYHKIDTVALAGTLKLAKVIDVPDLKLATVAPALGVAGAQTHRAMDDCLMSMKILQYTLNVLKESAV